MTHVASRRTYVEGTHATRDRPTVEVSACQREVAWADMDMVMDMDSCCGHHMDMDMGVDPTLSLNILRAFSRIALFFCCISRFMIGLGASLRLHLSCFANARSERHVAKLSQYE